MSAGAFSIVFLGLLTTLACGWVAFGRSDEEDGRERFAWAGWTWVVGFASVLAIGHWRPTEPKRAAGAQAFCRKTLEGVAPESKPKLRPKRRKAPARAVKLKPERRFFE